MREIKRSALVAQPPARMFALINDIERYPQFVPWVTKARIESRTAEEIVATLSVKRGALHTEFTTRNVLEPDTRIGWVGPLMGARTFASARLMEVWAHGQDIYDLLRRQRVHHDRIRAIAELGVRTFSFTFTNRGLKPPGSKPHVRLVAPSGSTWEWNPPDDANHIAGSAIEFCHVVTQGRNILDTRLDVVGEAASQWMSIAQCFAGRPSDPPAPGERSW